MKNSISNSIGSSTVSNNSHTNNTTKNSGIVNPTNVIDETSEINENAMDAIAKKFKNNKQKNQNFINSTNNPNLIQSLMIGKFNSLYNKNENKNNSISHAIKSNQSIPKSIGKYLFYLF